MPQILPFCHLRNWSEWGFTPKASLKRRFEEKTFGVSLFRLTCIYSNSISQRRNNIVFFLSQQPRGSDKPSFALTSCLRPQQQTPSSFLFFPTLFLETDYGKQRRPRRKDRIWMSTVTYQRRHKWHSKFVRVIKTRIISVWSHSDKRNKSPGNFNHDPGITIGIRMALIWICPESKMNTIHERCMRNKRCRRCVVVINASLYLCKYLLNFNYVLSHPFSE